MLSYAPAVEGKLAESVNPVTQAPPSIGIETAYASSSPLPPRYVLNSREPPFEASLVTTASYVPPPYEDCVAPTVG